MLDTLSLPEFIGLALPVLGIVVALGAHVLHALGTHGIGGAGAGLGHHLPQELRIFQKRAGTEHVVVEGHIVVVGVVLVFNGLTDDGSLGRAPRRNTCPNTNGVECPNFGHSTPFVCQQIQEIL